VEERWGYVYSIDLNDKNVVVDIERVAVAAQVRQPAGHHPREPALGEAISDGLAAGHFQDDELQQAKQPERRQDAAAWNHHCHRLCLSQCGRHARPRQP
jgi:hypothetical protein